MLEKINSAALKLAYTYLDSDPDKNIPKLMDWADKLDKDNLVQSQRNAFRSVIDDKESNWYKLIRSVWTDLDAGVRKSFFHNFIANATVIGGARQNKFKEKYDINVPWAILMDPTSACNLKCTGCWAADYGDKMSLSLKTMDDIIRQGKELGVYFYIYSGGEPLVRKKDIIKLCEKHQDCMFSAFTNGTLIDEEFADDMLRVKNFIPAISIEGDEEATDSRRGVGTYQSVIKAMEILKNKKLAFGASLCYTSQNVESIGSEEFIDELTERGAKFAWFFTYIPVGVNAVPELLVSDEQREYMYRQLRKFRETKPIFTVDFWNDGEYVEGCIAGGRKYLHINAGGDIEPCAFIHYANYNIHNVSILEALQSPLFKQYKLNQPFNENHLRPCPLLDNPEKLAKMVDKSGAHSTDMQAPEDVHDLCGKCVRVAEKWAVKADELWKETLEKRDLAEKNQADKQDSKQAANQ
jgi:MoaA/NifB/PqqE/SkfB family radical SAM enzyme